jgi:hypothetical protein
MVVSYDGSLSGPSYLSIDLTNADVLTGNDYAGWCADLDVVISPGTTYAAHVLNAYDPTMPFTGLLEQPQNVNSVAWLLNQDFRNVICPSVNRFYSVGEIQWALWELIEGVGQARTSGMGANFDATCRQNIYNLAISTGSTFVPNCKDEEMLLLLEPIDTSTGLYCHQAQWITAP